MDLAASWMGMSPVSKPPKPSLAISVPLSKVSQIQYY